MKNCDCYNQNPGFIQVPRRPAGCRPKACDYIKTYYLPPNLGTDEEGQPYAPKPGAWTDAFVIYEANGAIYFYDHEGVPLHVTGGGVFSVNGQTGDITLGTLTFRLNGEQLAQYNGGQSVEIDLPVPTVGEIAAGNTGYITGDMANTLLDQVEASIAKETGAREEAVTNLETDLEAETEARLSAEQALTTKIEQYGDTTTTALEQDVQRDTTVATDASTVTVTKVTGNLKDKTSVSTAIALPVASEVQAGVMSAAVYQSLQDVTAQVEAMSIGSVEVAGLPADPTQEQLTTAWKTATGKTELIPNAKIFDSTNNKIWTYYGNTNQWSATSNVPEVTPVNIATTTSAGIVKASTTNGMVMVEADGTMSLNGYDTITSSLSTLESAAAQHTTQIGALSNRTDALEQSTTDLGTGKQDTLVAGTNIKNINGESILGAGDIQLVTEAQLTTATNALETEFNEAIGQANTRLTTLISGAGV